MGKDNHNIKQLRKLLRLTQQELANLMRIDKGTVSRWERGEQVPRPLHLRKMDRLRKKIR